MTLPENLEPGSVLIAVDAPRELAAGGRIEVLPDVAVAKRRADPAVYGVFIGWGLEETKVDPVAFAAEMANRPAIAETLVSHRLIDAPPAVPQERVRLRRSLPNLVNAYQDREEVWTADKQAPPSSEWRVVDRQPIPPPERPPTIAVVTYRRAMIATNGLALVRVQGPCQLGDLLVSSDVEGCAEIAKEGVNIRYLLGKALGSKKRDEPDLVRAVIWAG